MHRDIKPENILVKKDGGNSLYKLADFGFAIKLNAYSSSTISGMHNFSQEPNSMFHQEYLKNLRTPKLSLLGITSRTTCTA